MRKKLLAMMLTISMAVGLVGCGGGGKQGTDS